MKETKFQKIIVIGCGRIAAEVLAYVWERRGDYGYVVEYAEHEPQPFGVIKKMCEEREISFSSVWDKGKLAEKLERIEEETLILSAGNHFLFPPELVARRNMTIVNFHNALLPRFPGRNAPSWAIYEGEEETGITWHYVNAQVDGGSIILQKRCGIPPDIKAYELAEKLMTLAMEGFCQCFAEILEDRVNAIPQEVRADRRIYRSKEIPGGGHFRIQDPPGDIYRLLRATDYGKNNIFPPMTAEYEGRKIRILRYRKVPAERQEQEQDAKEGFLYLPLDSGYMLKLKYGI